MNQKTGVIVGTFDPFTIGHDSNVRRALPLFDRLVIGVVGDNVQKPGITPAEQRMQAIVSLYAGEPRIEVRTYYGLAVDFARSVGARYIVKGVRSAKDFEYEREQGDINRLITNGEVETLLLMASLWNKHFYVQEVEGQRIARYRSLYFDTPDAVTYTMHHNRQLHRQKIRQRVVARLSNYH